MWHRFTKIVNKLCTDTKHIACKLPALFSTICLVALTSYIQPLMVVVAFLRGITHAGIFKLASFRVWTFLPHRPPTPGGMIYV